MARSMVKLAADYQAKALKTRSYLGACNICLNCGTAAYPSYRKCINPRCRGDRFRTETSQEGNARLNAYDAEQARLNEMLSQITNGAL